MSNIYVEFRFKTKSGNTYKKGKLLKLVKDIIIDEEKSTRFEYGDNESLTLSNKELIRFYYQ